MRQYRIITIIIASLIVTAGIGCTNDDTTELAWFNAAGNPINDIIWANDDQQWTTENGYADQTKTESKKVNALYGIVIASIDEGSGFREGTVIIEETGSSSLSLHDGSSEVYTISSVNP